ncbi:MAG: hypothetical protein ACD_21C00187G0006 [uncultured bacterium]|nr:MAG: hypothetical protein ACD_21C00187G0006 [uncultured bacterium]
MGRPNEKLSSASEWRYGNKGSLVISMGGDKRGLWHSFETGESGNLLTLMQKETGLSFNETLKYASSMLGGVLYINSKQHKNNSASINSNSETYNKGNQDNKDNKEDKTSKYAQKLATESRPIAGTIVEKYLKEIRSISNIDSPDVRYHPRVFTGKNEKQQYLPAMLSLGRDKKGKLQCVQATYLDPKTANKADLAVKKRTYASPSGALVSLQGQESKNKISGNERNNNERSEISFIAEGAETGLSIKDAVGAIKNSDILVTLGKSNFSNIDPQSVGQKIVFCLDNDGEKSLTDNTIHKAAQRLIDFGKEVFIAIPDQMNNKKTDFNDVAKIAGIDTVKGTLNNSVAYSDWRNSIEKNNQHQGIEISPSIAEKVMQKDRHIDDKLYNSLFKSPEVNFNAAMKFVDSEQKGSFSKYLSIYRQMQNYPSIQKNIEQEHSKSLNRSLNTHDLQNTQKTLSKNEREIY